MLIFFGGYLRYPHVPHSSNISLTNCINCIAIKSRTFTVYDFLFAQFRTTSSSCLFLLFYVLGGNEIFYITLVILFYRLPKYYLESFVFFRNLLPCSIFDPKY